MMKWILGYFRFSLSVFVLGLGGTLLVISSWIPISVGQYHISMWLLVYIVRILLFILKVRVDCTDPTRLRQHHGFIFPNHVSYLEVLALVSVAPVRFLAKDEVRSMPIIGQIATAIGCVFVNREDKKSRTEARQALAQVETFPPIVLFPEGKRNPGDHLLPFRYGAFEIVTQGSVPFLTCAVSHDPLDIAIWHRGESVVKAVLRLAAYNRPVHTRLMPLDVVQPQVDDDPVQLSLTTHEAMTAVLFPTENNPQITDEN